MATILVVADEPWIRNEVHAALSEPDYSLIDHRDPNTVADVVAEVDVDAVLVDLQVGSMGGMAITRAVRDRAALQGTAAPPVVLLLDRKADVFLARRAGAAGWVIKPFTSHELRSTLEAALAGVGATSPME